MIGTGRAGMTTGSEIGGADTTTMIDTRETQVGEVVTGKEKSRGKIVITGPG